MVVRTERSEVGTKTTEGQYSPVRLELARLVSSLLYGTRAMLVLNFPFFENKKYTAYDRFRGNGPYGKIPTKKEPIRTLGFALLYNNVHYHFCFLKSRKLLNKSMISIQNSLERAPIVMFSWQLKVGKIVHRKGLRTLYSLIFHSETT